MRFPIKSPVATNPRQIIIAVSTLDMYGSGLHVDNLQEVGQRLIRMFTAFPIWSCQGYLKRPICFFPSECKGKSLTLLNKLSCWLRQQKRWLEFIWGSHNSRIASFYWLDVIYVRLCQLGCCLRVVDWFLDVCVFNWIRLTYTQPTSVFVLIHDQT